jgi:hypothetical protein
MALGYSLIYFDYLTNPVDSVHYLYVTMTTAELVLIPNKPKLCFLKPHDDLALDAIFDTSCGDGLMKTKVFINTETLRIWTTLGAWVLACIQEQHA